MESWQSETAFVVHFLESTDIGAGRVEGKVEHIISYRAARFQSVDELLAFVGHVLANCAENDNSGRKKTQPSEMERP